MLSSSTDCQALIGIFGVCFVGFFGLVFFFFGGESGLMFLVLLFGRGCLVWFGFFNSENFRKWIKKRNVLLQSLPISVPAGLLW